MNLFRIWRLGLVFLFLLPISALAAEKQGQPSLPREQVQKLKDIAGIIAGEIARRNITTVTVMDFTDMRGKPSAGGKVIAAEFRKQITASGKGYFKVVNNGGGAVVKAIFLPFEGGDKWKLDIKVMSPDNRLITSYSAFYRKINGVKK